MKSFFTFFILLIYLPSFSQTPTLKEWDEQAKTNKRLLPKYGNLPKSKEEKEADATLIRSMLAKDTSRRNGSNEMIKLGFSYLYVGDVKTGMYRFNQAFLLDSTNADIYRGYGGVYMKLGAYERAKHQYQTGLSIDPANPNLLTDYATYFMGQYNWIKPLDENEALRNLDSALTYLSKSYQIKPDDQSTTIKLSVCYFNKSDCENAWRYYNECKALGGLTITEEFSKDLKKKCKREK